MLSARHSAFWSLTLTGIMMIVLGLPAFAAFKVPQNEGYVTDLAGVMSPEAEAQAEAIAQELDTKTQSQVAILTIPRQQLGEIPVEDASLQTSREWGVGRKKAGNTGLLIFMAVSNQAGQSRLRTEIGYGLEGIITDGTSGAIQDQVMIPAFKQGNYDAGLLNGLAAYCSLIAREKQGTLNSLNGEIAPVSEQTGMSGEDMDRWLTKAIFMVIIMVILALAFLSMLGHMFQSPFNKRGQYRSHDNGLLGLLLLLNSLGGSSRGGGGGFGSGGFGGFGGGGFGGGGSSRDW